MNTNKNKSVETTAPKMTKTITNKNNSAAVSQTSSIKRKQK